jgi:hypothetical protein
MPCCGSTSMWECCGRAGEVRVDLGAVDDQRTGHAELAEVPLEPALVLARQGRPSTTISSPSAALATARAQASADLLGQVVAWLRDDRAERLAAAAELRHRLVAVTGADRCPSGLYIFLVVPDLARSLGLVRALLALGELPAHHAVQDVLARARGRTSRRRDRSRRRCRRRALTVDFMISPAGISFRSLQPLGSSLAQAAGFGASL